jgi:peptidylprolyl isomerase
MTPGRSGRRKTFQHTPSKSSKKLPLAIGLLIIIGVVAVAVYIFSTNSPSSSGEPAGKVLLQTSMGNITIQLRDDRPITTSNFKNLVQQGVYDGTIFHRVISDFMIQGGDPTGTGAGDPSIPNIQDEVIGDNENNYGTIAMAKTGKADGSGSVPDSASSQFYINVANNNWLDSEYTVFGTVTSGMDVAVNISNVPVDGTKPVTDVTLIKAEIIS